MILQLLQLVQLSYANECVRFFILKEGLIRPDQDVIVSRSPADYYAADFRVGGYGETCKTLSCVSNKYNAMNNCGKVKYYEVSNNITFIESMIMEPEYYVLDTDVTYVDWYVLKDESATAGEIDWHIDGQVMPREYVTVEFYDEVGGEEILLWSVRVRRNVEYDFDDDVTIYDEGRVDESLGYDRVFVRWRGMEEYECLDTRERCEEGKGRVFNASRNMKFVAEWRVQEETSEMRTEEFTVTPTEELTESLTEELTMTPTEGKTESLTEALTEELTITPTEELTVTPTEELTEQPTEAPTEQPTESLTFTPIASLTFPFTESSHFNAFITDKPPALSPPVIAVIVIASVAVTAIAITLLVKCCATKQTVNDIHKIDGLISL